MRTPFVNVETLLRLNKEYQITIKKLIKKISEKDKKIEQKDKMIKKLDKQLLKLERQNKRLTKQLKSKGEKKCIIV